jgi:hypothetical protein
MTANDYWAECISEAASDCGLSLTKEQLGVLAHAVEMGHEHYGMAFYSPPSTDRINDIEREYKAKIAKLEADLKAYRHNAETAIKQALGQPLNASVSIGEHGEVTRYDGRFSTIQ